jgi:hypothetical protein
VTARPGNRPDAPLQTYEITFPFALQVIARSEREARDLMGDHLAAYPPDWLHLRVHDSDVTATLVVDTGSAINVGRYEDDAEDQAEWEFGVMRVEEEG